ncbi:MAG: glycosyltransferase family 4 protein [Candidatus Helarchaeota archaeon]
MRIGIISSGTPEDRIPPLYGGGIQKYIWNLGRELNKIGHEIHIFARKQPGQLKEENIDGIFLHRITLVSFPKSLTTALFGFKTLLKILKIQKCFGPLEIIHAQSRVSGLVIRTFQPNKPFVFTGHNWDIGLTRAGQMVSFLLYAITLFIEKRLYERTTKIIALTDYFQKIMENRYHVTSKKIEIIPNMVNIEEYMRKRIENNGPSKKMMANSFLLFVGRLEKEKGVEQLIRSFKQISETMKTLKLAIVGTGTHKKQLIELKQTLDLDKKLQIMGKIREEQLTMLLKSATALILPSEYEIMPTIVLEAWAVGCPVISNKYPGYFTLLHHRRNCLLYENKIPEGLGTQLKTLLLNATLKQSLIRLAKELINSKYASSIVTNQILKVYQSCVLTRKQIRP